MSDPGEQQLRLLRMLKEDRWLAHATIFKHRHPDASPPAHKELVEAIYSPRPRQQIEGFRGFAKSTLLEETAVLRGAFREFHNMVIVGSSYRRACDRLAAVKRELEMNEFLIRLFGPLKAEGTWQEGKIVLASGVCIQALGRDQSMLGIKHLDWRPDAALVDDVEDPDEVRTDIEREATWDWFLKTFLPSLDHPLYSWVRVLGTRRGAGSLPERLEKDGWPVAKFPIEHQDDAGDRVATWPAKFPLPVIDEMRATYRGDMDTWMQEYMCEATSTQARTFRREQMRVVPRTRTWEAVYAMYDPARTVGARSATTGKAVWSWVQNRLVVWDAAAELWLPDRLIADIFLTAEEYGPIWIGVEEDGLNEWIRQPLRHEQYRRGQPLPIRPLRAPRGKLDFIRSLQPYFEAGEVEFAKPLGDLETQFLSFPFGKIDAPNALAYALSLRPGAPLYDGFSPTEHVAETVLHDRSRPLWLACNATRGLLTAVAFQHGMGRIRILGDYVIETDAPEGVPVLVKEVGMAFRTAPTCSAPPGQFDRYMGTGLVQALRSVPLTVEMGADVAAGRESLRDDLGRLTRGEPAVRIARAAKYTLNALAGGYCRAVARGAGLSDEAEDGVYKVMMEGLESCLGRAAQAEALDEGANWAETADGRRYMKYGRASGRM